MNILDIVLLLLIAVLVILAWRRTRKKGGCCGDCQSCGRSCTQRAEKENKK